jgi:hypothetical protein
LLVQDSLQVVASLLQGLLPNGHVLSKHMERLAEKNLSARKKAERRAAEELIQVKTSFSQYFHFKHLLVSWLMSESGKKKEEARVIAPLRASKGSVLKVNVNGDYKYGGVNYIL